MNRKETADHDPKVKPAFRSRSYGLTAKESTAAAAGAPTRGFNYEQSEDYAHLISPADEETFVGDSDDVLPDEAALDGLPNGAGESYAGDPDIGSFGPQDLRFGGEDISGVSEWTMRAHQPELDDGLDTGDFKRPDTEIYDEILEALQEECGSVPDISIEVHGAEVHLAGTVESDNRRRLIERIVQTVPGVREIYNQLEITKS